MPRAKPQKFSARLESIGPAGAWTRMQIPFDVEQAFGSKARVSVRGTMNGYEFRSSIFPNGDGTHHLMVNKAMREGAAAGPGDTVKVVLQLDDAPRSVEIPEELAQALARDRKAREAFDKLAPSHRAEYARWVGEAKKAETRERRAAQALEMLAAGKRLK